jgi:hypothetical protein
MRTPQAGVPDGPATVRGGAGKGPPPRRSRPHSPRPLHPGSLLRAQPQPSALRIRLGPCGSGWPGCRPPPVAAQHAGACRRGRAPCASVRPRSTRPSRGGPCSRCLPWSSSCRRCVSWPALARRARASRKKGQNYMFFLTHSNGKWRPVAGVGGTKIFWGRGEENEQNFPSPTLTPHPTSTLEPRGASTDYPPYLSLTSFLITLY